MSKRIKVRLFPYYENMCVPHGNIDKFKHDKEKLEVNPNGFKIKEMDKHLMCYLQQKHYKY